MRYLKRGCIGLIIGILLELFVFGFGSIQVIMNSSARERTFTINDFETENWTKTDEILTSQLDPVIIATGVDEYVERVTIYYSSIPQPDSITVSYTNSRYPVVCQETLHSVSSNPRHRVTVAIRDDVQDFRIDLGEAAGLQLSELTVVFNEKHLDFSVSRVVAMVLIWIVGSFLFGIQKMPDYHLESFGGSSNPQYRSEEKN